MAKKSTSQEKALPSGQPSAKAKKNGKPAKNAKPASAAKTSGVDKSTKPAKTRKAAAIKATISLAAENAVHAAAVEKPAQACEKPKALPVHAPATATPPEFTVVGLPVAVLEKPQPAPERAVYVIPTEAAEVGEASAARPETVYSDEANALYVLGIRYSTGRDVEQDLIAAHKWFNLAAMMGHEDAKSCRADVSSEMSKAQIAEAQRQARDWLRSREVRQAREPEPVKRPIYVRRRAQAIRSANSFARTCACA
jgi:uncharacterized protein